MAKANPSRKRKPEDDLETKPVLREHRETSEEKVTTKGFADTVQQIKGRVELLESKSDQANLISVKETVEGLGEKTAARKKTLFVDHLHPQTKISDIIDFFNDVGQVIRVRLTVDGMDEKLGCGFVEFASSNEAKRALQERNGEYLHDCKILLVDAANRGAAYPPPKFCIDHMVWNQDYLQRESIPILPIKEDETPPDFVEDVLFIANLSPQTNKMVQITRFFKDVGEVVSVRLAVDRMGKHLGYGFVEFASAYEAKMALEEKNGEYLHDHPILLMKGVDQIPDSVEAAAIRNKTVFVANFTPIKKNISDIIGFFKDVGEVVHVRLILTRRGRQNGFAFVEFASANEAKKALEKNGECLDDRNIVVRVVETPYPQIKYCLDHNVEAFARYEDNLRQAEDAGVKGLDEPSDFVEDVAVLKKTLFVANLSENFKPKYIKRFFKSAGEVVRIRLIVDQWGERVGYAFVEFASANEAKKALKEKNRGMIFLFEADIAPYPFRLKYDLAEKLWYEDNLRRFSLEFETKPDPKRLKETPHWSGKKIIFSDEI
ncbi:hypothetical protein EUTSA_v10018369mg [Eutrema salsugineum]|uniref:RRM domain-containing protein n=1 Tax=Eutrema salsugineum TaxID=72664 RepID=V4KBU4_EUTSA|nr:polyadenylate-binding protein, cytoplasmic and nuclear [Eutrema salsugineum]ESQ28559.1 hypothetical protein EUTSA_v10018369mg [Eutrema salsugineum]